MAANRWTSVLPEAFGLVCVASKRHLGLRPFDVQLAAGVVMHQGALAELATGEGKTLCATLPAYLNALAGKGVHVTTVNDYLARRDAETDGADLHGPGPDASASFRWPCPIRNAHPLYRCDITYGTASEFGFDFLRDRLKVSGMKGQDSPFWDAWLKAGAVASKQDSYVQRPHHFALVDEADNIFIDEARTPLIIASPTRPATRRRANRLSCGPTILSRA